LVQVFPCMTEYTSVHLDDSQTHVRTVRQKESGTRFVCSFDSHFPAAKKIVQ